MRAPPYIWQCYVLPDLERKSPSSYGDAWKNPGFVKDLSRAGGFLTCRQKGEMRNRTQDDRKA